MKSKLREEWLYMVTMHLSHQGDQSKIGWIFQDKHQIRES